MPRAAKTVSGDPVLPGFIFDLDPIWNTEAR